MAALSPEHARYVAVETLVSVVINSILSLAFTLLAVGGREVVPLFGPGGVAFDFIPQVFMITLATTLATTLLARKRLRAGAVAALPAAGLLARAPVHPLARAVVFAIAVTVVGASLSIAAVAAASVAQLPAPAFIALKVAYGAVLSLLITPPIVRAALAAPPAA